MWAESGSFLIRLPKYLQWFINDYNSNATEDLESTLKFMVEMQLTPTEKIDKHFRLVIDEM